MRAHDLSWKWVGAFLLAAAPGALGQSTLLNSKFNCGTLDGWSETDLARNPAATLWHQECFCGLPITGSGGYAVCSSTSTFTSIFGAAGTTVLWTTGSPALPFCASTCADPANGPVVSDDESSAAIVMPFPFDVFGSAITSFEVSNNGFLTLGSAAGPPASVGCTAASFTPDPIPSLSTPDHLIAPWWADLVASATGSGVAYNVSGAAGAQVLTVEWKAMREWSTPCLVDVAEISVQARLFEGTNEVEFLYDVLNPAAPFAAVSVGLENATGTLGASTATPGGLPPCNALKFKPVGVSTPGGLFTFGENPFAAGPIPIPDGPGINVCTPGTELMHTITVPTHGIVNDLNVHLNLTHTWYGDLDIMVTSPAGTVAFVKDGVPDDSSDLGGTYVLDDEAAGSWDAAATATIGGVIAPGSYSVDVPLSGFDGEDAFGTWTIKICDTFPADIGTLVGAVLEIDLAAIPPVNLPSSFGLGTAAYNQGDIGVYTYNTGITGNSGALESPLISPSAGADRVSMSFDYIRETEGGSTFDVSTVEARGTGDCTWKQVLQLTALVPCSTPGSVTFSNDVGLNSLVTGGGNVRFAFDSIDGVSNDYLGWYVDNVLIREHTDLGVDRYGAGCACSGPCVPSITTVGGGAIPGNGSFGIGISNATGAAFAALFVGFPTPLGTPLGGGCDALLDLTLPFFHAVRVPMLAGTLPGEGCAVTPMPIPCNLALVGGNLAFQWAVADLGAPGGFCVTDALDITVQPPIPAIVVEAVGTDSFNATTNEGFFKVIHSGSTTCGGLPSIVKVKFSFLGSTNPSHGASANFDLNQAGMADVPYGGNSVVPGCLGTYRNGSDVATGLVYGAPNLVPACDLGAFSGLDALDAVSVAGVAYKTVEFDFAPGAFDGDTFEWDCDTDSIGTNLTGGGHAGLVVVITLSDATVLMGNLMLDPGNPQRSFLNF